jgi:DNA polymerase V
MPTAAPQRRSTPFIESPKVLAGFPSPATDYIESSLDLNELMIRNPPATFFCKVSGVSMLGAHIDDGDIVCVDRSLEAIPGRIVVATYDGELLIKWLERIDGRLALVPDHPSIVFPTFYLDQATQAQCWGRVTGLLRRF